LTACWVEHGYSARERVKRKEKPRRSLDAADGGRQKGAEKINEQSLKRTLHAEAHPRRVQNSAKTGTGGM